MNFTVTTYDDKGTLHDSLGISRERADQIRDVVVTAWGEADSVTRAMKLASEVVHTLNELALAMLLIGQVECGFRLKGRDET